MDDLVCQSLVNDSANDMLGSLRMIHSNMSVAIGHRSCQCLCAVLFCKTVSLLTLAT